MNRRKEWTSSFFAKTVCGLAGLGLAFAASATVLDDFNDNTKTGWTDSNPGGGAVPGGQEAGGQFTFNLPAVGQPFFVASTKTSTSYELKEGRTLEFRVDMVSGLGPDSFTVMGFIPQATGANTLAGYGIAKSESDILITKGINKYFYNENVSPPVKNENVTLVLNLKVKGGEVYITARVLDKDNGDSVLWERSFVDTTAADALVDGTDDPAAPYLGVGNFVLYLYADGGQDPAGYQVVYDNAEVFVCDTEVVDDFNDNTRTGWQDSNPMSEQLPPAEEAGGQFTFNMPMVGQPYFMASTKQTRSFELAEGTRHEFHVDMVSGQGPDSFAVLAFIPDATGANTLAGYGIAKSESDILIIKGMNQYFYNENPTPSIKNTNVRLSIELTVRNGNVEGRCRVFDTDDNDNVLFDKSFVDTPAADPLVDGTDSHPAPYITSGNIVLYLYADEGKDAAGYQVVLDNLGACAPPSAGNEAPVITDVLPAKGANFLAAPAQVTFKASDDKALPDAGISVTLNGTTYTTANGLTLSGSATSRSVTLAGLAANQVFVGEVKVVDSDAVVRSESVWFDTFAASNLVIEVEDYNFDAGQFIDNPVRSLEFGGIIDNSYTDRVGVPDTDFHDTRTAPNGTDTMYRTWDSIRMQHSLDLHRAEFNNEWGIYDYDVGDIAAEEWMNYTRTFAAGSYEVYLREAVVGFALAESVLEQVTGDPTQPDPAVKVLGSFLGTTTGYTFRSFPLTDGTGQNKTVLRLSGATTLRLRQATPDAGGSGRYLNYLVFLPVQGPAVQRAAVTSVSPANDATVETVTPAIAATIQNRDTSVKTATVVLKIDGATVPATVTATADGATLAYTLTPLPASNTTLTAQITFQDSENVEVTTEWHFTVIYKSLGAVNRQPGPGTERGFQMRVVQASPDGGLLESSLDRAESQLAPNSPIPAVLDTNLVVQMVEMSQDGGTAGFFQREYVVPGLEETGLGTDNFTVEAKGWLELAAGTYRFTVISDDGFKVSSGASLTDKTPVVGFRNGSTADEITGTFEFVVPVTGFYPFRMIWYERGGGAHAEWSAVNLTTGERLLINDPDAAGAIKAYVGVVPPAVKVQSSATVASGYADDATAVIDTGAKRITVPQSGAARFYRLTGATALRFVTTQVQGANIVMTYD